MHTSIASRRFALELISIFIAVFLAVGVNEWRESHRNKTRAATALQAVIDEIYRNTSVIEYFLPSHEEVLLNVNAMGASESIVRDSLFFYPVILRNTAWRTASETGAFIHMNYENATAIAEVYTFQEAYASLTERMMASSFNVANYEIDKKAAQLATLKFIVSIFIQNEKELLKAYERTLAELTKET